MTRPAAPLEKAVAEAREARSGLDTWHANDNDGPARIALCIASLDRLLAALDADRKPCEPGVICPTCVALEDAENALKEVRFMTDGFKSWTLEDKVCGIARRYFARRDKLEVPE